jgi:predicted dehydrogenase
MQVVRLGQTRRTDMTQDHKTARRAFISGSLAAFTILPRHVLGGPNYLAPSDKLNIAGVGVGAMGGRFLQSMETENIVALADVDHDFAAKTFARYPSARRYKDFRVMLEKEKGIDAVVIGTPDHTHAVVAMAAIKLGKHVYCAKPLTRTISELRQITAAAREAKVATQMSTQTANSESACSTAELIQSGVIGAVREIHVVSDRPIWPQGIPRPVETYPMPSNLDWDLWIGPAPMRAFHPTYHPFNWRGWYDFGCGALGDMALHMFHVFFNVLKLTYPTRVQSFTTLAYELPRAGESYVETVLRRDARGVRHSESFPHSEIIAWDFPARGKMPPVRLLWYDGGLMPPRPVDLEPGRRSTYDNIPGGRGPMIYIGEKGVLLGAREAGQPGVPNQPAMPSMLLPAAKFKDFAPPPKTIPRSIGHYQEWIAAAKGGPPANCNWEYAKLFTETALLGVIAARTGKDLAYDAQSMRFTNDADANQYLNSPSRPGWSL